MATTPQKLRRRPGRPTRQEELQQTLAELGIDPALIDPRRILASIASDADAPASARVSAARALLLEQRGRAPAEMKQPGKDKAEARPSKKAAAARAAATAGGAGTLWGSDLDWSTGGGGRSKV
jgi:hypothetical protein